MVSMRWLRRSLLLALVIPSVASAVVIEGIETQRDPPVPPASPPPIARSNAAVFIDFDDTPEPCPFILTTALRTKYAALGVTFDGSAALDGGGILDECGNFGVAGHSSPNFLAFNSQAAFADSGIPRTPQTLNFTSPVSEVSVLAASNSQGLATMRAYDAGNALVSGHTIALTSTTQLLTVGGSGIVRVVIDGPPVFILDDLAFSYGIVPTLASTWGRLKTIYR